MRAPRDVQVDAGRRDRLGEGVERDVAHEPGSARVALEVATAERKLDIPDMALLFADNLVVFDHVRHRLIVIANSFQGRRLNRPNDVVVKSDGCYYFTDPNASIVPEQWDLTFAGVYRVTPDLGTLSLLSDSFVAPNGLAFSPDESVLYINDSAVPKVRAEGYVEQIVYPAEIILAVERLHMQGDAGVHSERLEPLAHQIGIVWRN